MKDEELKMLRQFVDTVFELTHGWDIDNDPTKNKDLLWAIGNVSYTAQNISRLYQEKEANHD